MTFRWKPNWLTFWVALAAAATGGLIAWMIVIFFADIDGLNALKGTLCNAGNPTSELQTCAMLLAADAAKQSTYLIVFALVGNAATICGLIYTYRESKRTADIAFDSLNADRAIIVAQNIIVEPYSWDKTGMKQDYSVYTIQGVGINIGKRNAINASMKMDSRTPIKHDVGILYELSKIIRPNDTINSNPLKIPLEMIEGAASINAGIIIETEIRYADTTNPDAIYTAKIRYMLQFFRTETSSILDWKVQELQNIHPHRPLPANPSA